MPGAEIHKGFRLHSACSQAVRAAFENRLTIQMWIAWPKDLKAAS